MRVEVSARIDVAAETLWDFLADFAKPWHPLIEWMRDEVHGVRAFKVRGEETIYREQVTYISHSDHVMRYRHLQGIAGCKSYIAEVKIADGSVNWSAEIEADEPRLLQIADGTKFVFEQGLNALYSLFGLIEVKLGNISLLQAGDQEKPLVIFLHGIGGNKTNWRHQLQALAPHALAVAMDMRGYGGSKLGPSQSTIEDYLANILQVMAHYKKQKVTLCGMSMGSWIATSFAMRHAEKLSGLILSGGCTGMSEAPSDVRANFLKARQGKDPAEIASGVADSFVGPHVTAEIRAELVASIAAISPQAYRDALNCFANPTERFDFSKITCPVLMMTGEFDPLAPPEEIRSVSRRISKTALTQFEVIAGAGHVCNVEEAATYNSAIKKFLI